MNKRFKTNISVFQMNNANDEDFSFVASECYDLQYYSPNFLISLILFNCAQAIITTKGHRFIVDEGDSVELPCNIRNIAEDTVVIWKRGELVLFTDEEAFHEDQRFQLRRKDNNFILIIERVEPYDGAKYVCEITSPEMSITHTLEVNGSIFTFVDFLRLHKSKHVGIKSPSFSTSYGFNIPDANPLLVNVGENMVIKCSVSGNPPPKVTWTRKDGQKMPATTTSKDGQLRITQVTMNDSGIYECTASNNIGVDAHDTIEVRVQAAPWVDSAYTYIPVKLDQNINLTCKYNAEPSPQVDWFYNGFTINFSDDRFKGLMQYAARQDNYSESILAIENIKEDNFGDYTCRVANNLGTKQKPFMSAGAQTYEYVKNFCTNISGRPGPPHLNASGTRLSWSVYSVDPVIEYQILYRFSNDDTWQQFKSIRANKEERDGDIWSRSEDLIWLRPGLEYELQMKARNTLGWGSLARSYVTMKTQPLDNMTNDNAVAFSDRFKNNCYQLSYLCLVDLAL
ncbi:MAM domain-containing glycosylphosphatidylinositol anchor protein 1 [Dirofilaria immitis]|nr:MAM domain-containing glycosylphosphatidylinositol anchor protein 1 [Dirofilaria immitis]